MGIGEACATALAAEGANIVLVSRSEVRVSSERIDESISRLHSLAT